MKGIGLLIGIKQAKNEFWHKLVQIEGKRIGKPFEEIKSKKRIKQAC